MTEEIYKVGDILEFTELVPRQFGLRGSPVRGLIVKISDPGYEYKSYRFLLFEKPDSFKNMTLSWAYEKSVLTAGKRVGHIDISLLRFEEGEVSKPDEFKAEMTIEECCDTENENTDLGLYSINRLLVRKLDKLRKDKNVLLEAIQERERTIQNLNSRIESLTEEIHTLRTLENPKFVEFLNQCADVKRLKDEIEALKKENKDLNDRLGDEVSGKWDNWVESGGF